MHIFVTSNFDDGSIKNEQASMDTSLNGIFFRHSRVANYASSRNFNSSKIDCRSFEPASLKRIVSISNDKELMKSEPSKPKWEITKITMRRNIKRM